jgi:hypothetical protein
VLSSDEGILTYYLLQERSGNSNKKRHVSASKSEHGTLGSLSTNVPSHLLTVSSDLSKGLVQAKQTVVDHAVFVEDLLLQSPVASVLQEKLVEPLRWNNGGSNNSDVGVSPTGRRSPSLRDRCLSWDNVRMAANRRRTSSSRNSSPGPFTALQQQQHQSDYVHQIPRGTILLFGCTIETNLNLSKPGLFAFTIRAPS